MDYIKIAMLSPYPIYDRSFVSIYGRFCHSNDDIDYMPHIELDKNITGAKKLTVLIHELTHARHYKRNCKCYRENDYYLKELHAYQFGLRFAIRYKMMAILKCLYHHMTCKEIVNYPQGHQKAITQLKTEKIWKKVENLLDIA